MKTPLLITPGSEQVRATIERDGLLADLEAIGATVLANACGPCIGQWQRDDIVAGETNTIVSSFNRNFPARNDGNPSTLSFIGSPETVTAMALTGRLDVDFVRESITAPDGTEVKLVAPVADELPSKGFDPGESGFVPPSDDPDAVDIVVAPDSDRLELLTPFLPWDGSDYRGLQVLMKAAGKCTTDHISPAGKWLRFRGHLTNISGNLFVGVNNAFTPEVSGMGVDVRDGRRWRCPISPSGTRRPASAGSRSATRTTARARRASTRRWSRGSWGAKRSSCAPSPGSTRPTSRSRACSP